jgi:N utilization substance protein A
MKSDFLIAITQLSAEKNLPKEVVITALEAALVSAYRKDNFAANQNISVKISPTTGEVKVWAEKTVVELPLDSRCEISLDEARRVKPDVPIGEIIEVEATPPNAGRIAAQTAKQVILQRLHEAEHSAIFEEYADKESDIVVGMVQRIEPRQIFIDLGRTEAVMPAVEQMRSERYRVGQRLKVYLLEVVRTSKGPRVVVSRSHPDLLRRLFELEAPEVFSGAVEIKSIAREAGYRSKVAVAAHQDGIDPVGCCVGLRGIRIQNIVSELNGEKIDVVRWDPDASAFIANALSPAQILRVDLDEGNGVATVVVPDKQLSLAIGKEGQNARLATKLTGWRIDIKSASIDEAEKVEAAKLLAETESEATVGEELLAEIPAIPEPALVSAEAPAADTTFAPSGVPFEPKVTVGKPKIRFAEDILISAPPKPGAKPKKRKKKGARGKEGAEDGIRLKRTRRVPEIVENDEEE